MTEEGLIAATMREEDSDEEGIRPEKMADFIGQESLREALSIAIAAAKKRGVPLDHTLFSGPPGLGKTTLAHIIAHEMGSAIHCTSGPVLEKAGDLAAILTLVKEGDFLFIDEIHRLPTVVEEILYTAMEDFRIDVMIVEGPSARSIKIELAPFTLNGATTRVGLLRSPFRDRFGMIYRLNPYSGEELARIVAGRVRSVAATNSSEFVGARGGVPVLRIPKGRPAGRPYKSVFP